MRDRLTEFLPLVLAGLIVLVFQLTRGDGQTLPFLALAEPTPTPQVEVAGQRSAHPRPHASPTVVVGRCSAAHPQFSGGLGELKTALGTSMGEPLECEHAVSSLGDTQQKTTTGLAYHSKLSNAVCFTTGWDHWAIVKGELVRWSGDAVDPPADAAVIARQ